MKGYCYDCQKIIHKSHRDRERKMLEELRAENRRERRASR